MASKEDVVEVLQGIIDPEIHIDIYTLELVYDVSIEDKTVNITMTLTTPACPYGPMLLEEVKSRVKGLEGVEDVNLKVTFDPPWKPSDQLRATLGV